MCHLPNLVGDVHRTVMVLQHNTLYGKSDLSRHSSIAFSDILSYCIVPVARRTGIIIPLWKKQTLIANDTGSYRSITLCSAYCKRVELYMQPDDSVFELQFGFRPNRITSLAWSFFGDIVQNFKGQDPPIAIRQFGCRKMLMAWWSVC